MPTDVVTDVDRPPPVKVASRAPAEQRCYYQLSFSCFYYVTSQVYE
jgi:hypothetical protein